MKDTIYFRHDYDSHSDPKIIKLRMKYWREWYGIFWAILEVMRTDSDILIRDSEIDAIAFRLHYDCNAMRDILEYMVSINLLCNDKYDQTYYSERLQDDAEYMREKSTKAKASADARRKKKPKKNAIALQPHYEGNAIKDSKVDDSIWNEIIEKDIIKEETTPTGVSWKGKSIINKHNKPWAIEIYDKIKEMCVVVDWTLDDCVVLRSKLEKYWTDPVNLLEIMITKMRDTGLNKYYSVSNPWKLADHISTIVEKLKSEKPKKTLKVF